MGAYGPADRRHVGVCLSLGARVGAPTGRSKGGDGVCGGFVDFFSFLFQMSIVVGGFVGGG